MNDIILKTRLELEKKNIPYREADESICIDLPGSFGVLKISPMDECDDIITLVDDEWHTHSDCLDHPELKREERTAHFLKDIFMGRVFLIKEKEEDEEEMRIIETGSLERYLKYLPEESTYEICNKI